MLMQFLRDEEGQTTVEYILIVAVIVVFISVLGKKFSTHLGTTIDKIFDGINKKVNQLMEASQQD